MITVIIDVIPIPLMGDGTMAFPVFMLLTYRLYFRDVFIDRHIDYDLWIWYYLLYSWNW